MHDAGVAVGANHMQDRVGLADVGEEAVAEALAAMRAGDQSGDVVEGDRVEDDFASAEQRRDLLESRIAHGHYRHVRINRRERVVGGLGAGARQGVEERGLAGVRQANDADPHRGASTPIALPSAAPASTSDG